MADVLMCDRCEVVFRKSEMIRVVASTATHPCDYPTGQRVEPLLNVELCPLCFSRVTNAVKEIL